MSSGIPIPKQGKKRKPTLSKLKKLLDKIFSQFIRLKYADDKGYVRCYTCGKVMHWTEAQCGHFVSRSHLATRFDPNNTRPQCCGCNVFGGGKTAIFATRLETELGEGVVTALYSKAQEIIKNFPYQEKIDYYTEKVEELKQEKGL